MAKVSRKFLNLLEDYASAVSDSREMAGFESAVKSGHLALRRYVAELEEKAWRYDELNK
jgi:hypothetical protein